MSSLEALELEAHRRGVRRFTICFNSDEGADRRYRALAHGGSGFAVRWYFGATPEEALEQLVADLPPAAVESGVVALEPDPFPSAHPFRGAAR